MGQHCRKLAILLCLFISGERYCAAQVTVNSAGVIQTTTLPQNGGFSPRTGLSLTFDPQWSNNYGYHPVRVTFRTLKPAASDVTISFALQCNSWNNHAGSMAVSQEVVLPQGSSQIVMTLDLPVYQQYLMANGYFLWDTRVNGVRDKFLSMEQITGGWSSGSPQAELSVLAVGASAASRQPIVGSTNRSYELIFLPTADLPKRWIEYTALDVVAISLPDLQSLAASNPQALRALQYWSRAGGQLWVTDVGKEWQQLATVEKLLAVPAPPGSESIEAGAAVSDSAIIKRGWNSVRPWPENWDGRTAIFIDRRDQSQIEVRDPAEIARLSNDPNYYTRGERRIGIAATSKPDGAADGEKSRKAFDSIPYFVDRPTGLGQLRLFRGNEVLAAWKAWQQPQAIPPIGPVYGAANGPPVMTAPQQAATQIAASAEPRSVTIAIEETPNWSIRHGVVPEAPNAEFSDWLLPGVGLAPVTEFRVLITLFVLLIGPVNYVLLRRMGRLQLLVITVPLAAGLLTLALFAYALVSDGLGTKVRVRSLTMLDQRAGEAATRARLSYYAGLAPGGGLQFSDDIAIYPILPDWFAGGGAELSVEREIVWSDRQAALTRGWLRRARPRNISPFARHASPLRLQLRTGDGRMTAKNDLAADIDFVVVADADGQLFAGENFPPGEQVNLALIEPEKAAIRLSSILTGHRPEVPVELAAGRSQFVNNMLINSPNYYGYYPGRYNGTNYSIGALSGNLMQRALNQWLRSEGESLTSLPPRSYVAVTQSNPNVEFGVKKAHEEDSFHVIVGQW